MKGALPTLWIIQRLEIFYRTYCTREGGMKLLNCYILVMSHSFVVTDVHGMQVVLQFRAFGCGL